MDIIRIEQLQIDKERLVDLCKMRENEAKANDEKYHTIKKELETTQDAYKVLETQKTTLDKEFNELVKIKGWFDLITSSSAILVFRKYKIFISKVWERKK